MSIFKKIGTWFKKIFQKIPKPLKEAIHIAVVVVDKIKAVIESPVADVLTMIIPGDVDDKIKVALRAALPKIFIELKLADKCAGLTDPNEIVKCGIETLEQIGGDFNSAFLHSIAVLIAQVAADGKLTWSDAVLLVEFYYTHNHKKSPDNIGGVPITGG